MSRAELQAGAEAFKGLIRRVKTKGDADLEAAGNDGEDSRDYRAIADLVRSDLQANIDSQDPAHREGYLRALADLLSTVADGCCLPRPAQWDPITTTEEALSRRKGVAA